MNKIPVLFLFIMVIGKTNSQSYFPIPADSSSQWRIQTEIWEPNPWWMVVDDLMYFYDGDTIIGSNTYDKLYASGSTTMTSYPEPIVNYYTHLSKGFTRNVGHKVYFHLLGKDTLLYDFTVQAGGHLPMTYINIDTGVIVTSIDSVLVGSQYRKRYILEGPPNGSLLSHWIIEGLGHEFGLIEIMFGIPDYMSTFECYAENSTPIYPPGVECDITIGTEEKSSIPSPITVFPNPSSGKFIIRSRETNIPSLDYQITNITGEKVAQGTWLLTNRIREIDLSPSLNEGMYFIMLNYSDQEPVLLFKLLIQK